MSRSIYSTTKGESNYVSYLPFGSGVVVECLVFVVVFSVVVVVELLVLGALVRCLY